MVGHDFAQLRALIRRPRRFPRAHDRHAQRDEGRSQPTRGADVLVQDGLREQRGQRLLHDIVSLLNDHGLVLRTLQPVPHFDGDLVEVNAFFTKSRFAVRALNQDQRRKFALLTKVWELPDYRP